MGSLEQQAIRASLKKKGSALPVLHNHYWGLNDMELGRNRGPAAWISPEDRLSKGALTKERRKNPKILRVVKKTRFFHRLNSS